MSRRGGGERSPEEREAARRERERRRYEKAGKPVPEHLLESHELPPQEPAPSFFDEPAASEPPAVHEEPAHREPAAFHEEPAPRHEPEPAHDPQATQAWDVTESWLDGVDPQHPREPQEAARQAPPPAPTPPEPAREAAPRAPEPEPPVPEQDPHATQAYDVHADDAPSQPADHDPHATRAHDVTADHDPHATRAHDVTADHDPHATRAHDVTADHDPHATQVHDVTADHDPQATQAHDVAAAWTDEHATLDPPSEEHEAPLGTRRVTGRERMHLPHIHRPTRGGKGKRGDDLPGRGRGVRVKRPGEVAGGGSLRRRRSVAGRTAAGVVLLVMVAIVWFLISLFQPFGGGDGTGSVTVRIPQGATAGEIGDLLAERGVVPSSFFFGLRAGLSGERSNLKSGTFRLREDMSYAAAIDALTRVAPPPPTITVAIPEGRSRRETVSIARRAGLRGDYLTASRRSAQLNPRRYGAPAGATLEGFLFPATYELPRGAKVQRLVDDQLRAFKQNIAQVDLRYARSRNLSVFDVLTIASMVEREVSVASERPLVAAVIYNRLRDGIPLGIDATLRFEQNDWVNPLKQSTLDTDTPYNTRTRQGLPPGPIGSPGLASIKAAANPARSNALYYVVKPNTCGEHAFSDSFERFQADVQKYNAARDAAGGKSPTRC